MKLWLLEPRNDLPPGRNKDNPWEPWYDKAFGFVVRAETEEEARHMATEEGGDELSPWQDAWTNDVYSTCVELTADGKAEIIIRSFASA